MHDVYISHSSKDIKRIQELQSYIEKIITVVSLQLIQTKIPMTKIFIWKKSVVRCTMPKPSF